MVASNSEDPPLAEARIEVKLNRPAQLFNSLDPSPFHEHNLDQDAEDYIVGSAEEVSRKRPFCLVIHLPPDQMPQSDGPDLGTAIRNYFAYREAHARRRLRLLFREGRIALVSGLAFLFCCVLLRELAFSFRRGTVSRGTVSYVIGEGMLIIGGWRCGAP